MTSGGYHAAVADIVKDDVSGQAQNLRSACIHVRGDGLLDGLAQTRLPIGWRHL